MKENYLKKNQGITLIALVITIIVLLILAGVSITKMKKGNGVTDKAKKAKADTIKKQEEEIVELGKVEKYLDANTPNPMQVGTKANTNRTIDGRNCSAMNPIIPEGYYPINTETSNWGDGKSSPQIDDVNRGLVITDNLTDGNEWVWVPVEEPSSLYVKENVLITKGGVNVITPYYTKSGILPETIREKPEGSSYKFREPDLIIGKESSGSLHTEADESDTNRRKAGFTSLQNMAEGLVNDYVEMVDSLEKYKGFYIGRYELSDEGEKRNRMPIESTKSWYESYAKCKDSSLKASNKVETRMIWGLNWDATCLWIQNNGDKKDIYVADTWGNCKDASFPANTGNYQSQVLKPTGSNEAWRSNNIYDLAGEQIEWTQEAFERYRAYRGEYYLGWSGYAAYRGCKDLSWGKGSNQTRAVLYLK